MEKRVYNFCAGPATMPVPVLKKIGTELLNFKGSGMSIMEMSHRSDIYEAVHNQAKERIRRLMNLPENYEVLFMTGGASAQFALLPMNFARQGLACDYVDTGIWSRKAVEEAERLKCQVHVAASSASEKYNYIPKNPAFSEKSSYVHITSNNTVVGTQYKSFPQSANPLIVDMSSDILSYPLDVKPISLIYAGAQKNIGPSGVCVVIARKDFIETGSDSVARIFSYKTHMKENSLYNTPPSFAIYVVGLVMEWLEEQGGIKVMAKRNEEKAGILYHKLDSSKIFEPHAKREDRSLMNVTFRLPDEALEKRFLNEAEEQGFSGLKGHRIVGGCRASIYNAFPKEGVEALVSFMDKFEKRFG